MLGSRRFLEVTSREVGRAVVWVFVSLMLVLSVSQASANGPVAYFPFNGSTDDASGYGNHAVVFGAVPTADRFGNPNSAYLVGSFGHLEAPDNDSLDITEAYSLSLWFRHDDLVSTAAVFAGKGANTAYSVNIYYAGSWLCPDPLVNRRIQASVGGARGSFSNGPFFDCGLNEWRHIVVTVRTEPGGSHTANLYVEGSHEGTFGMMGEFANNTAPLGIGKDGETNDRFAGAIDDLRLYDRELTADEISELYNSLFIDGFESGSVSSWMSSVP